MSSLTSPRRLSILSRSSTADSYIDPLDPNREELERFKKNKKEISNIIEKKKKKESKNAVYKDPIYGIPHCHEPALRVIMDKRDIYKQMNDSMRLMTRKSSLRLRKVQAGKPRYTHNRFDIETLLGSPLMCFPHFQEMASFLMKWFDTKESRRLEVTNKGLSQQAKYEAISKFCDSLFLLLQEAVRSNPLTPQPLSGIYKWFLNRDIMIQQSKQINLKTQDLPYILIELPSGEEVHVLKKNLDCNQVFPKDKFTPEYLSQIKTPPRQKKPKLQPIEEEVVMPVSKTRVLRGDSTIPLVREPKKEPLLYDKIDMKQLHQRLRRERQDEKDADKILKTFRRQATSSRDEPY